MTGTFADTLPTGARPERAPGVESVPPTARTPLEFTGRGGEYFRIWIVNTLLTMATLGIYSAWAKVRKASYFARNTRLLGDSFEFVADPLAILRGRILAVALLGFYTFAFDFSLALGLVACAVLLAAAPLLFASATRFRLQNTRWRAIRFAFDASWRDAYRVVFVVVAVWISSTVVAALGGEASLALTAGIALVLLPWMHHRMKAFQHRHASFAGQPAAFRSALGRFYGTYLIAGAILFGVAVVVGVVAAASSAALRHVGSPRLVGFAAGAGTVVFAYLAAWPYFATRIQRAVWERTTIGRHAFATSIAFKTLWPLAARNALMLLVTAGLYWPFAAVAWARYRIECMSVVSSEPLDAAVATIDAGAARAATGEGAVDFFGIDVGW